jgi:hypothetical protein
VDPRAAGGEEWSKASSDVRMRAVRGASCCASVLAFAAFTVAVFIVL